MIGNVKYRPMGSCLGSNAWDKFWNAVGKAGGTVAELGAKALAMWELGQLSTVDYKEIQLALAKQAAPSDNTKTILIVGGVALAALALGIIGTRNK